MKKNNKRMLVAVLAMAMALSMTACAEEPAEDTSSSEPDSSVSEQVSEPETSDLEVEDDTSSDAETETSDPAADNTSSSAADTGSSTASQPAADTTTSQPASSQVQQSATSGQSQNNSSSQNQSTSTPPATTQTSNTSSGKGPMSGYNIEVYDWETPATTCLGESYNGKAGYVLRDAGSNVVGMVPSDVVTQLLRANGLGMAESDVQFSWFVSAFNEYRGVEGGSNSSSSNSSGSNSSNYVGSSSSEIDIEKFREEVFQLVNEEREKAGVPECVSDSTAMEYAQIRAEELAEKFSHESPNGSIMEYSHYTFAENIAKGQNTPEKVVSDWMASPGHRSAMLTDYSNYGNCLGVGVYEESGTIYWVLEFILWDANA